MSLQVWLPLNGNLQNQGLSNLTFSTVTTNTTMTTNGKIGLNCYQNNSKSTGGLISDNVLDLGQQQSMFCWFKFTDLTSSSGLGAGLVSQHRYESSQGMGITIKYVSSTTGYLSVNTGTGSSRTYNTYCGTTLLQANTWYHGGYTYDGETIKIYVDGKLEKTQALSGMKVPADYITAFCWSLKGTSGRAAYGGYNLNGCLNDVRIYDHCLSTKEVEELAKGLILHYKLNNNGLGNPNLIANSKVDGNWTYPTSSYSDRYSPLTLKIPEGDTYTLSFDAKSTVDGDVIYTYYYSPNTTTSYVSSQGTTGTSSDGRMTFTLSTAWTRYWVVYHQSATTQVKHLICPRLFSGGGSGTVSVKNVKFEEGSVPTPWIPATSDTIYSQFVGNNNTIYDSSGYNNDGEQSNVSIVSSSPRYNAATDFSNSAYIKVTDNKWMAQAVKEMTINLWAKASSWPASGRLFSCTESGGFNLEAGSSGYWRFPLNVYTNSTQSSTAYAYDSQEVKISDLPVNEWVMLTFIYNGTGTKTYINGELHHTYANVSYGIHFNTNARLFLACEANTASPSSPYFTGQMSDFRIYNTVLTEDQIKELYNTSASIDNEGNIYARELVEL